MFPLFYYGYTNGERNIFFRLFTKIQERHRDIKEHSNNKVIIVFGIPKFTITSYYSIFVNRSYIFYTFLHKYFTFYTNFFYRKN